MSSVKVSSKPINEDVVIQIGLTHWCEKTMKLKPMRTKRLALRVKKSDPIHTILLKASEKWKAYYPELYNEDTNYIMTFENGNEVIWLPGTYEPFILHKYKEDFGKDYKRIVLYLCSQEDQIVANKSRDFDEDQFLDDDTIMPPAKFVKFAEEETYDELSRECALNPHFLESEEEAAVKSVVSSEEFNLPNDNLPLALPLGSVLKTAEGFLESLLNKVNKETHFFIVTRRGITLPRILKLWQRETLKNNPTSVLTVKYTGEDGIDTGALRKEFLADILHLIAKEMFPDGTPLKSTLHIQNGNFLTCGEIVAVSLAQGGPPPCFLSRCAYDALYKDIDLTNIIDDDISHTEKETIERVKEDCKEYENFILDNNYTGLVRQANIDEIVRSLNVSFVSQRSIYMKECSKGLSI